MSVDVVFDTWAWWEVLAGTARGRRLHRRYLKAPNVRVHTSALAMAELSAKYWSLGDGEKATGFLPLVRAHAEVHDVRLASCLEGARLRQVLRTKDARASLADGIMLALAQELEATLISGDAAFRSRPRIKAA